MGDSTHHNSNVVTVKILSLFHVSYVVGFHGSMVAAKHPTENMRTENMFTRQYRADAFKRTKC